MCMKLCGNPKMKYANEFSTRHTIKYNIVQYFLKSLSRFKLQIMEKYPSFAQTMTLLVMTGM